MGPPPPPPRTVCREMARVVRPGGRVVIEDIIASEQSVRARYQDRLERLRDRSHPGYLRVSQIIAYAREASLTARPGPGGGGAPPRPHPGPPPGLPAPPPRGPPLPRRPPPAGRTVEPTNRSPQSGQ